jgi:DNA (cytosine-5)-methyltransferase 1
VDAPAKTITAANRGERALVVPVVAAPFITEHANASHQRNMPADAPLRTQCAQVKGGHFALASVFLAQHNTGMIGHAATDPVSSITGTGSQQAFVACSVVKYYGADQDPQMLEPLHSVTTMDRFGLVHSHLAIPVLTPALAKKARQVAKFLRRHGVEFEGEFATVAGLVIVDIGMRMLVPRELFRAQGFPEDFVIDRGLFELEDGTIEERKLTGKEQVKMCGNSVSPLHAMALIRANLPELQEVAA